MLMSWSLTLNIRGDSLVEELLDHKNVIEVDEGTPAAVHDLLV
jgi:hypothetical protein